MTYAHEKLGAVTTVISLAERPWALVQALRTCVAAIFLSAALLSGAAAATHKPNSGSWSRIASRYGVSVRLLRAGSRRL
jgi:hypothetical protein